MTRLICLVLTVSTLNAGHAVADNPASPCFDPLHSLSSLALINDTAVAPGKQLVLAQPQGPVVTYQTKTDADGMANRIMLRIAQRKEVRSVMLTSHEKTLTVTGDLQTQKIVLEVIAEIENPRDSIISANLK